MSNQKSKELEEIQVIEVIEVKGYLCPLDVTYDELEVILAPTGGTLTDYVGSRLPQEEVQRIEKDFEIYLTNKHK